MLAKRSHPVQAPRAGEEPGAIWPRLFQSSLCYLNLLGELEVRFVLRAVLELHHELSASARPPLVGLPDVVVLAGRRVVGEAARSGDHGLLDVIHRSL